MIYRVHSKIYFSGIRPENISSPLPITHYSDCWFASSHTAAICFRSASLQHTRLSHCLCISLRYLPLKAFKKTHMHLRIFSRCWYIFCVIVYFHVFGKNWQHMFYFHRFAGSLKCSYVIGSTQ